MLIFSNINTGTKIDKAIIILSCLVPDINECELRRGPDAHKCGPNTKCVNRHGGYKCKCILGHWYADFKRLKCAGTFFVPIINIAYLVFNLNVNSMNTCWSYMTGTVNFNGDAPFTYDRHTFDIVYVFSQI